SLQGVRRAAYTQTPTVQYMRVDHGRAQVAMPQQLLHRPDVGTRLEEMSSERMAKRVTGRALRDPRTAYRVPHGTLNGRLVQMMPPLLRGPRITLGPLRRKYPLPRPLRRGARHLALERPRQNHPSTPTLHVARVTRPPAREMIRQRSLHPHRQRHDPAQHGLVQEQQGRHRLILRRCTHPNPLGEMLEKRPHLGLAQLVGMLAAVEHDEPLYPPDIRLLRARAVMPRPHRRP